MFHQESEFFLWKMVQHILHGVTRHYNLCQSSFAEIKPLLDLDVEEVVAHRCLREELLKGNVIFVLE